MPYLYHLKNYILYYIDLIRFKLNIYTIQHRRHRKAARALVINKLLVFTWVFFGLHLFYLRLFLYISALF